MQYCASSVGGKIIVLAVMRPYLFAAAKHMALPPYQCQIQFHHSVVGGVRRETEGITHEAESIQSQSDIKVEVIYTVIKGSL